MENIMLMCIGVSILLLAFKTIRQGKRIKEMKEEIKSIDQQIDAIWNGMIELAKGRAKSGSKEANKTNI